MKLVVAVPSTKEIEVLAKAKRRAGVYRRESIASQRGAAMAMEKASWDMGQRLDTPIACNATGTVEERHELVAAIFPRRAP